MKKDFEEISEMMNAIHGGGAESALFNIDVASSSGNTDCTTICRAVCDGVGTIHGTVNGCNAPAK